MRRKPFLRYFFLIVFFLLVLAGLTHKLWLHAVGHVLVRNEAPAKSEIAVVLAGDDTGHRIGKAAELVKAGYAPAVLVSGPSYFDIHECDVAIEFAVRKGYPAGWFVPLPNETHSTREEAVTVLQELSRRGVHHFLLVTSNYHTARAARIYQAAIVSAGGGFDFRVVASPDPYFDENNWWHDRQGLKTVFFEWSKTVATALGQ